MVEFATPEAACLSEYPVGQAKVIAVDMHEPFAVVLLKVNDRPPHVFDQTLCTKGPNGWEAGSSSNGPGWFSTSDRSGVITMWGESTQASVKLSYLEDEVEVPVVDGMFFHCIWDARPEDQQLGSLSDW